MLPQELEIANVRLYVNALGSRPSAQGAKRLGLASERSGWLVYLLV
jgi:hypothetical protein